MATLIFLFGVQGHISAFQEACRAVLIFFYGLTLLRLSGRRTFGHWSALDVVVSVIVGSALGRAMTGSAPLLGTMVAAAVMTALHVIIAHATTHSRTLAHIVEGVPIKIADHGRIDDAACKQHMISDSDLAEALRQEGVDAEHALVNVKLMLLEPSGKISVVKHEPCKPDFS